MDVKLIEKLNELAHKHPNYELKVTLNYRDHWDPFAYLSVGHEAEVIELGDLDGLQSTDHEDVYLAEGYEDPYEDEETEE